MRVFCIIFFLFSIITLCVGQGHGTSVCHKGHHYHKFLYLHHLHYLAFFVIKFKVILVLGALWAFTVIIGKVFAAFKIAEYMKKDDHHVIYSGPSPDYHHHKSFESPYFSSPPQDFIVDHPTNRIYKEPGYHYNNNNNNKVYKTLPANFGRSYLQTSSTPLENLNVFFKTINRMNLTETVFREMKIESSACKRKFVCEADFNVKQSVIVKTIFNLFIDDCYKKYRNKEDISNIEECTKLNPKCLENMK